jgi:hypothetical protein
MSGQATRISTHSAESERVSQALVTARTRTDRDIGAEGNAISGQGLVKFAAIPSSVISVSEVKPAMTTVTKPKRESAGRMSLSAC